MGTATDDLVKYYYGNDVDADPETAAKLEKLGYTRTTDPSKLNNSSIVLGGAGAEGGISDDNLNGAYRIGGLDRTETANKVGNFINDMSNIGPTYSGSTAQQIADAWAASQTSGYNISANNQIANIQNNLAAILSNLQAEKSGTINQNQKDMKAIAANEFNTGEQQKELMNQSGWNPNNSGLAVGELTKIHNTANNQRANAADVLTQALNDIARRANLAKSEASTNVTNVNNNLEQQLAGVAADALLKADELGYSRCRDSVSDFNNDRAFNYQVSRDQVLDSQWLSQFNESKRQAMVNEAIQKGELSISEGRLALDRAAQAWSQSPNNPDNQYKQAQIDNMNDKSSNNSTVGALYSTMMASGDPDKWLQENGQYLTNDEFSKLYSIAHSKNSMTAEDIANALAGGN
jgi:polyhydroxyalkanoate synthesis regulator phasin